MSIAPSDAATGRVHDFSVRSSADAAQQFARVLRGQDLLASAETLSLPGLQSVNARIPDPYAPGGDSGPTPFYPMYRDPETGGMVPGVDPARIPSSPPEPAKQSPLSPQSPSSPQPAQQSQPAAPSGQPQAAQPEATPQKPETVTVVPAGADEHVFGLPDVTGHKEGDTWEEFLPPTPGNPNGIRRVNTIPIGNGTQTVDQVIYNADGTITYSRVVANGLGGYQRWNNDSTGAGSYVDKQTADMDAYIQSFDPGSSTSGAPDRESGANRGWTETYANSYDSDGNLVGTDRGVRNAAGLYDNIHSDLLGNRLVTLVTPDGKGGIKSRLAMQLDPSGNGTYIDTEDKEWTVFPDGHVRLGMQRTEVIGGGVHSYQSDYRGVVTHEFKPKSGKPEEWYRDTTDVDGYTSRLLADFTVIKFDKNGKEISRTERPERKAWWENLGLGIGGVGVGMTKAGWAVVSYPFRKLNDAMASMSSMQVAGTGIVTTYPMPDRESEVFDIAKGSVMPIVGLLKYGAGTLSDSMASWGSLRVTPAGIGTTYKPPDRAGELIHDATGLTREQIAKNPWFAVGQIGTTLALMSAGPKGRAVPARIGTSMDATAASILASIIGKNVVKLDVIPFVKPGINFTEMPRLEHGWGSNSFLGKSVSPNFVVESSPRFSIPEPFNGRAPSIFDVPSRGSAPVTESMGIKLHSLKPPPDASSMAALRAPRNSPLTGAGAATPKIEPQSALKLTSIADRSPTAKIAEVQITMDAQVEASVGSGRAPASRSGTGAAAGSGRATGRSGSSSTVNHSAAAGSGAGGPTRPPSTPGIPTALKPQNHGAFSARSEPYSGRVWREWLELRFGSQNVKSSTIPESTGRMVHLAGKMHPKTEVPYDYRGFPIFDAKSVYDTRLPLIAFRAASYAGQMRMASVDLSAAISRGEIDRSIFTPTQLRQIHSGAAKIEGYTWHHHQDTARMQLVRERDHRSGHIGGEGMSHGR
ncbi:HNH endonuclease [Nocardia tengchongensis]|uniref:HNH endonuclease n=1 Tax=Nocardia tengchongensis TaxID=2055889 RepID=UPI0036694C91